MILGLGIDLVRIERIERAMARNPRFLERVLTPAERALADSAEWVAGRWAAKEAIAKAVPIRLSWQDVEVLPGLGGKPIARVLVPLEGSLFVSITHERDHAAAVAALESVP